MPATTSRSAYTALTPEYAEFNVPHTPVSAPSSALRYEASNTDTNNGQAVTKYNTKLWKRFGPLKENVRERIKQNAGLLLIAGAQFFFSIVNLAVKELNGVDPPVSTLQLVFVRMAITYMCAMSYMLGTGVNDPFLGPKGVRLLLVFRGFIGFFGLFGVYYSLQYLSLSDATVLTFLAPMCTGMAGSIFLGETFTRRQALAGVVSLVGVVLIARPTSLFGSSHAESPHSSEKGTPTDRLIAVGVALVGVIGATGAYTTVRAIGKRAHPLHSLTFFSMLCVIVSTTGITVTKTPFVVPTKIEWLGLLGLIGLFGFIAQVLLTMGLQRETAGRGTMAVYTQIVFATILERIFFHTVPSVLSIVGTLLILGSALYVALTKESNKEQTSKTAPTREDEGLEEGLLNSEADDSYHLDTLKEESSTTR